MFTESRHVEESNEYLNYSEQAYNLPRLTSTIISFFMYAQKYRKHSKAWKTKTKNSSNNLPLQVISNYKYLRGLEAVLRRISPIQL